jgi:hypothetical protein
VPLYACHNSKLKYKEETWRDLCRMEHMRGREIVKFMGAGETLNKKRHVVKSGCGRIIR